MKTVDASRDRAHPHPKPDWFTGPVLIQELNEQDQPRGLEVFAVFFEAGARTLPHVHSTDQLLYFVDGEGIVGTVSERRLFRPGSMAIIPAEEWHWHGATPTSAVCHLSIRPGGPSTWSPEVPMLDWETYMEGAREEEGA